VGDGIGVPGESVAVAAISVLARQPANNSNIKDTESRNENEFRRHSAFSLGTGEESVSRRVPVITIPPARKPQKTGKQVARIYPQNRSPV
jgi:hypothetical protein